MVNECLGDLVYKAHFEIFSLLCTTFPLFVYASLLLIG